MQLSRSRETKIIGGKPVEVIAMAIRCDECPTVLRYDFDGKTPEQALSGAGWSRSNAGTVRCQPCTSRARGALSRAVGRL